MNKEHYIPTRDLKVGAKVVFGIGGSVVESSKPVLLLLAREAMVRNSESLSKIFGKKSTL